MSRRSWMFSFVACALLMWPVLSFAQDPTGPPQDRGGNNQDRGGRGMGRGNFDPAAFQQRMMDDAKDRLGVTEDEWKVMEPKIQKLMDARRDAFSGGGFGGFGRGGRNRGGDGGGNRDAGGPPPSALRQATDDLRTTLENKSASTEDIAAKLKAVREAKEKAQADVQSAQKDLKGVLTQRQEATLVSMGWLD